MTQLSVFWVPWDSGNEETRMGRGPGHLLRHGLAERLREQGRDVEVERIDPPDGFQAEVATTFALHRLLAERVDVAVTAGRFPLVLSGNCGSSIGACSGIGLDRLGLIWLDAHGDFNTPETSASGFIDGMCLATLVGHCWQAAVDSVPEYRPLAASRVVHVGGRDLDAAERERLADSGVTLIEASTVRDAGLTAALTPALERLSEQVEQVYLHIDLDVLDPEQGCANSYAAPGGLSRADVEALIGLVGSHVTLCGLGIASYDPDCDDGRVLHATLSFIDTVVALLA